jgi:hydroxyquinol 1,2-dioxygenase
MLLANARHPWRPAHIHFLIEAAGHQPLVTHIFREGDQYLDSDVVFGVRPSLVGQFAKHAAGVAADGRQLGQDYWTMGYVFSMQAAESE